MKNLLGIYLLFISFNALSNDIVATFSNSKLRLDLLKQSSDPKISCEKDARVAKLLTKETSDISSGCWIGVPEGVQIAWLDGEYSILPYTIFKRPIEADSR